MIPSLIRTYAPIVVAYVVGWLASLGIDLTGEQQTALTGIIGTVAAAVYYTAVRLLERKWPALSVLLGSRQQPAVYVTPIKPKHPDTTVSETRPVEDQRGNQD